MSDDNADRFAWAEEVLREEFDVEAPLYASPGDETLAVVRDDLDVNCAGYETFERGFAVMGVVVRRGDVESEGDVARVHLVGRGVVPAVLGGAYDGSPRFGVVTTLVIEDAVALARGVVNDEEKRSDGGPTRRAVAVGGGR